MQEASSGSGAINIIDTITHAFPNVSGAISGLVSAFREGASASQLMGTAVSGLWNILSAHPILTVIGAVTGLIALFDKFTITADEANANMNDSMSAYESSKQSVADINTELDQTKQSIDEFNAKEGLTFVEEGELAKLREARDLLEIQKDMAEREELNKGKQLAEDTIEAYHKNFQEPISSKRTKQLYNERKGTASPGTLLYDSSDVSAVIAGIKLMEDLRDKTKEENGDWSKLNETITTTTDNIFGNQVKTLAEYKKNLEAIPYDELTADQKQALDEINNSIDFIYKQLDPSKFKQMKFDEIFDTDAFADMKKDLVELAKESNNAGIQMSDIPKSLQTAVENAGFTVDDLINNINSEAGIIDVDKFAKQIKKNFKNELKDVNPEGLVLKPGIEVEPDIENLDELKERYFNFSYAWDQLSDEEKKQQITLNPSLDIDVDAADFNMAEATKKVKEKYKDALGLEDYDISEEVRSQFNGWVKELSDEDLQLLYNATVEGNIDTTEWDLSDWQACLDDAKQQMQEMGDAEFEGEMTFSAFLETNVNPEDEESDTINEFVDSFQEKISTVQDALDSVTLGEEIDVTDLIQEFPELAGETDNLGEALSQLKADSLTDFITQWHDLTSELTGEDAQLAQNMLENIIKGMDWSDVDLNYLRGNIYSLIEDTVNQHYGTEGMTGSERLDSSFITDTINQYRQQFESFISEMTTLPPLTDFIQGEELTTQVSDYQTQMENLMTVREKLNDSKGHLDTADLQEALELCPDLINYLDDLEGGIDELSATANDDILGYFTDQIDALREAGRNADADALQEYVNTIIENANTIEQTFIRIGNMKIPAPDLGDYREALETENQGAVYDEMYSGLEKAKELYEQGLTGTDEFKTFAALISPTGSDDPVNFLENLGKAERYLTEDSSGLQNFMADMEELGYATQDGEEWSWNLGNGLDGLQEAADRAGISLSFMLSMFGKAEEYGAYNDFFTTEEEGADKLDQLYSDLAAEKRHLAEIEANPDTEGYDTAIEESKAKIAEYEERIEALKGDLETFGTYTPEQAAQRAEEAIQVAQSLQEEINNTSDEAYKSHLQEQLDDLMQEYHLTVDVDGNFTSLEEDAANLDLEINFEAGSNTIDGEIEKVSDYIDGMQNGTIEMDTSKLQQAQELLTYLLQRKQELEQPAVMEINDSQLSSVDNDIANAIVSVQQLQTAYDTLQVILGQNENGIEVDTTEAQAQLDAAVEKVKTLDAATQEELGLHITADMTNEEIIEQIKNMDLSMFDEVHSLQYRFDIQNKEEFDKVIADIDKLPNEAQNVTVSIDLSQVNQEELTAIKTSLNEFKESHPTTNVVLEGVPYAEQQADEVIGKMQTLDKSDAKPTVSINNQASGTIATIQTELNTLATRAPVTVKIVTERTTVNKTVNEGSGGSGTVTGRNNHFSVNTTHGMSGAARVNGDDKALHKTTKKDKTLVGELGREMVVDPQTNEWHTVGDNGPEITEIPDNAIVFNHKQTEDLLKKGHTKQRGKAMLHGNAASRGGGLSVTLPTVEQEVTEEKKTTVKTTVGKTGGGKTGGSGNAGNSSSGKEKETFDWIEIAISRLERTIERLGDTVDNVYASFRKRNSALSKEIRKVTEEISLQQKAAARYEKKANAVDLDPKYKKLVQNGTIDIKDYDADTASKIKDYQQWYEKMLECKDATKELNQQLHELCDKKWELRMTRWEGKLQNPQHNQELVEERIDRRNDKASDFKNTTEDTKAAKQNIKDYQKDRQLNNKQERITKKEYKAAKKQLNRDVKKGSKNGGIDKGTEAYKDRLKDLQDMQDALQGFQDKEIEIANNICEETVRIFENTIGEFDKTLDGLDFQKGQIENDIELRNEQNQNRDLDHSIAGSRQNIADYKKENDIVDQEIATRQQQLAKAIELRKQNLKKGSKNGGWDEGSEQDQEALELIRGLENDLDADQLEKSKITNSIIDESVSIFNDTRAKFDADRMELEHTMEQAEGAISRRTEAASSAKSIDESINASNANIADYRELLNQNKMELANLQATRAALAKAREDALREDMEEGSEEDISMLETLNDYDNQIDAARDNAVKYANAITDEIMNIYNSFIENFENKLKGLDHIIERLESGISMRTAYMESDYLAMGNTNETERKNRTDYRSLIELTQGKVNAKTKELNDVRQLREQAESNGINRESKDYIEMLDKERALESEIDSLNADIIEKSNEISQTYVDIFNNIADEYENKLGLIDHMSNMVNESLDQAEAKGRLASEEYYKDLLVLKQQSKSMMEQEKSDLETSLSEALSSGEIELGSKAYYDMRNAIDKVTEGIQQADTEMLKFENDIRQAKWDNFDYLEERIGRITDEANFMIELMSDEKLVDENGNLTNEGISSVGLHAVNYDTLMSQADDYGEEIKRINKELANDPANKELISRKEELIDAQQESILAAEKEKQAMQDLVKQGIDEAINHMGDLIDKYKDALENARDLYEYQRNIADQTKNIASLEKQLSAYENDTSEEAKATVQKLKVELEEAQQDLKDTEFDHYISEQEKLLDNLRTEFEESLNSRFDDIDALMLDMIKMTNDNAGTIRDTLNQVTSDVGYDMTTEMDSIWSQESNIVSMYGDGFNSRIDTTNTTVSGIKSKVEEMKAAADAEALAAKTWRETESEKQRLAEEQAHKDAEANGQSTKDYGQKIVDHVDSNSQSIVTGLEGEAGKNLSDIESAVEGLKGGSTLFDIESATDDVKDAVGTIAPAITGLKSDLAELKPTPESGNSGSNTSGSNTGSSSTGGSTGGTNTGSNTGGSNTGGSNTGANSGPKPTRQKERRLGSEIPGATYTDQYYLSETGAAIMNAILLGKKHPGKLTKEEKEQRCDLWQYITENYGYAPTNSIYRKIAKLLDINVTGTGEEPLSSKKKTEILNVLKEVGFAKGLRRAKENRVAWIDEKGQEVILRPSKGAILTDVMKDDTILDADAAKNLWKLTTDPAAFIGKYSIGDVAIKDVSGPTSPQGADASTINMGDYAFTINLPSVTNYEQFRAQLMKDKMMEQYLCSVTVDPMLGKNKSAKYRFNP